MAQQCSIVFLFRLKLGIEIPSVKAKPSCLGLSILRSKGSILKANMSAPETPRLFYMLGS